MKNCMWKIVSVIFFVLMPIQVDAQYVIKGLVQNNQQAIPDVHILLYSLNDTTQVFSATVTDNKGHFVLSQIPQGDYRLIASNIRYEKFRLSINNLFQNIYSLQIEMNEKVETLDEITVEASHVINKFDQKILFPTELQKKKSINGIELIDNLHLSGVFVDKSNYSISGIFGGKVLLRINGAPANRADVMAIEPELVQRVEYHDMPSMRYGNEVEAVVDLYVKRPETGGSVSLFALSGLDVMKFNGNGAIKLNHAKSEFSVSGMYEYFKTKKDYGISTDSYHFEDGTFLTRHSEGIPSRASEGYYKTDLNYSYYDANNIMFLAKVSYNIYDVPTRIGESQIHVVGQPETLIDRFKTSIYKDKSPSLNLYFQKNLPNKQFLAIDVVASNFVTDSYSKYQEFQSEDLITDVLSDINGNKYSVIAEGIYEKRFNKGKLSTGLKQNLNFLDNTYEGTTEDKTKMNQYRTNAYVQWQGSIDKFNYRIGAGGIMTKTVQGGNSSSIVRFKPTLQLGYNFNRNAMIRYDGNINVATPNLGSMNDVKVEQDGFQILSGNPKLDPVSTYRNIFTFLYSNRIFRSDWYINYDYTLNPLLRSTYREKGKFVTQTINGKSVHDLGISSSIRCSLFKDLINVILRGGYSFLQNNTEYYSHSLNTWYIRAGVNGSYKNFTLSIDANKENDILRNENITYRGYSFLFGLDYKWKKLKIGTDFYWSPKSYNSKEIDMNIYTPKIKYDYSPETRTFFRIRLAWNFNFGRRTEEVYKRIENSSSGESGILK